MTASRQVPHPFGRLVAVELPLDARLDVDAERWLAELPSSASVLRRVSYVAGRLALQEAAGLIGPAVSPTGRSGRGAPVLPTGFSGSVSHKRREGQGGPSVVAVALVSRVAPGREAVGVDLETHAPNRRDIAARILTPNEQRALGGRDDDWPFVLSTFSVKEAIYKAIDPFLSRYVAFHEAELVGVPLHWPTEGGGFVNASLSSRPEEPAIELEAFLQAMPAPSSDETMIVSAARARLTRR